MKRLLICIAILLLPLSASAQPVWFPSGDWQEVFQPYQIYVSDGDSAWVYPTDNGDYGRAQEGNDWRYHCPGMLDDDFYTLAGTQDSLDAAKGVAQALVQDGEGGPGVGYAAELLDCVDKFRQHLDTLEISGVHEKTWNYATECETAVDNATVRVEGGLEPGDTLAVYTGDTCAGYGVPEDGAVTMAAAEAQPVIDQPGYTSGKPIRIEVYDESVGKAYRPKLTWTECDLPVCGMGTYERGTYHKITSL